MKKQSKSKTKQALKPLIQGKGSSARKFKRLMKAIAESTDTLKRPRMSHAECQALLAFYVDSERRGKRARELYPGIFSHLKSCRRCKISYESLTAAATELKDRETVFLAQPTPELPFIVRADPSAAWNKQVRSPIGGAPLSFAFTINPSLIARMVSPPQLSQSTLFRGKQTDDETLLLLDSINLGSRQVQVELRIHRSETSDRARLQISVVSTSPLPEPVSAKLSWDGHEFSTPIQQGVGWIDNVPLSELKSASISVHFEVGLASTSSEA